MLCEKSLFFCKSLKLFLLLCKIKYQLLKVSKLIQLGGLRFLNLYININRLKSISVVLKGMQVDVYECLVQ